MLKVFGKHLQSHEQALVGPAWSHSFGKLGAHFMSKNSLRKIENCRYRSTCCGTCIRDAGTAAGAAVPAIFDFSSSFFCSWIVPPQYQNVDQNVPNIAFSLLCKCRLKAIATVFRCLLLRFKANFEGLHYVFVNAFPRVKTWKTIRNAMITCNGIDLYSRVCYVICILFFWWTAGLGLHQKHVHYGMTVKCLKNTKVPSNGLYKDFKCGRLDGLGSFDELP